MNDWREDFEKHIKKMERKIIVLEIVAIVCFGIAGCLLWGVIVGGIFVVSAFIISRIMNMIK